MIVYTACADDRLKYCKQILEGREISGIDRIILLPIPTAKDAVLDEWELGCSDMIVGYGLSRSFVRDASRCGAIALDVGRDEEYLVQNAALTAKGAVGRLLTTSERSPEDMKIGIIGYGRIGQRLTHILLFLGAKVIVFTSKSEIRRDLCMLGVSGVDSAGLDSSECARMLGECDVVINTAPAKLLAEEGADCLSDKRVIELASGDNIPGSISYERFGALPAKMYPMSAGRVLAESILRMCGEK